MVWAGSLGAGGKIPSGAWGGVVWVCNQAVFRRVQDAFRFCDNIDFSSTSIDPADQLEN